MADELAGHQLTPNLVQSQVRPWRVLHACEKANTVGPLMEAQSGVGMKPQILARQFWRPKTLPAPSLMTAWNDVRDWRHALNAAETLSSLQIVHAHCFAAAMAGVRGGLPCVYDFSHTLEETATTSGGAEAGPWLLRSFRVAEQFVLSRASAVVTHAAAMYAIACDRGASPDNVFVVGEPLSSRGELVPDRPWASLRGIDLGYDAVLFALPAPEGVEPTLRAFADILGEIEKATLLFEDLNIDRHKLLSMARAFGVADNLRRTTAEEREMAAACANVLLVPSPADTQVQVNPSLLWAMSIGKAVVAADTEANRECSPEGCGVIWYKNGDARDLAHRAAFVARNAEFAHALGESGRSYVQNTRSLNAIGRRYNEVYQHAQARRRDNLPKIFVPQLYTANAQV